MTIIHSTTVLSPRSAKHSEISPLGFVALSELGACLEVLGNTGTIAEVVAFLAIGHAGLGTIEECGSGALGIATVVQ